MVLKKNDIGGGKSRRNPEPNTERALAVRFSKSREWRQMRAIELKQQREERSDKEQLDKLYRGGHGHCKEAKRLRLRIEFEQAEQNN